LIFIVRQDAAQAVYARIGVAGIFDRASRSTETGRTAAGAHAVDVLTHAAVETSGLGAAVHCDVLTLSACEAARTRARALLSIGRGRAGTTVVADVRSTACDLCLTVEARVTSLATAVKFSS
jgi:hypothetical protein